MNTWQRIEPGIFKSHEWKGSKFYIYIYRHVGDVLIYFYYYLKKFNFEKKFWKNILLIPITDSIGGNMYNDICIMKI